MVTDDDETDLSSLEALLTAIKSYVKRQLGDDSLLGAAAKDVINKRKRQRNKKKEKRRQQAL